MDIGGHLPIPLGPPPLFILVSLIIAQLTIFGSFMGPKIIETFCRPK